MLLIVPTPMVIEHCIHRTVLQSLFRNPKYSDGVFLFMLMNGRVGPSAILRGIQGSLVKVMTLRSAIRLPISFTNQYLDQSRLPCARYQPCVVDLEYLEMKTPVPFIPSMLRVASWEDGSDWLNHSNRWRHRPMPFNYNA